MALSIESRALSIESRALSIESRENISDDKLKIVKLESKIVKLKSKKKSKDEKITKLKLEIKSKDEEITELINKLYIHGDEFANEYFKFGKYKGKSFKHVAINYPAYAGIIELQAPSKHFRDFLRFFYNWKLNEFNNI